MHRNQNTVIFTRLLPAATCGLALAACSGGGGGGNVQATATPPPVVGPSTLVSNTPLSSAPLKSPGLVTGRFDTIALIVDGTTSRPAASPAEIQLEIDATTNTYTLHIGTANAVVDRTTYRSDDAAFGTAETRLFTWSNGATTTAVTRHAIIDQQVAQLSATRGIWLRYDLGNEHVAMGQWLDQTNEDDVLTTNGEIYFVHGVRTAPTDIPLTGSASYRTTLNNASPSEAAWPALVPATHTQLSLTADFGARTVAASLDRPFQRSGVYINELGAEAMINGIDVEGFARFSDLGNFAIPLSGTETLSIQGNVVTPTVAGELNGAFFGPQGAAVGGTIDLGNGERYSFIGER